MIHHLSLRHVFALSLISVAAGCTSSPTSPQYNPTGDTQLTVALGMRPYGLALAGGDAFVTQLDGATVSRISLSSLSVAATAYSVGPVPTGAALSPDASLLLVSNQADASVSLVQTYSRETLARFSTTGSPLRVLFSPDGTRGYATTGSGALAVFDIPGRRVVVSLSTGLGPINGIAFSPDGASLYLSATSGGIATVDPRTNSVVRTYPLAGQLQEVVPSPEGDVLYVADESGGIATLSLASGQVTRSTVARVFGLAISGDRSKLWATQPFDGTVTILDRVSGSAPHVVSLRDSSAATPRRVAFDRDGSAVVTDEAGFVHLFR